MQWTFLYIEWLEEKLDMLLFDGSRMNSMDYDLQ